MSDIWEVKLNGGCYGRFEGSDSEKKGKDCFRMRLEARPKNTYVFELYRNGTKVSTETSSTKGGGLIPAQTKK